MNKKIKFKGWDWTELAPLFRLQAEYDRFVDKAPAGQCMEREEKFAEKLRGKILSLRWKDSVLDKKKTSSIVKELRRFLKKVTEQSGLYKSYFQGILNLEDEEVFLQMFSQNLTCMWT